MKLLWLLLLPVSLFSCSDPCEGLECISETEFSFTIKDSGSGKDLLAGSDPQLTLSDVGVYFILEGKKEKANARLIGNTIFVVTVGIASDYVVEAMGKTDTLYVKSINRPASECCPSTKHMEEIRVNGNSLGSGTQTIELFR